MAVGEGSLEAATACVLSGGEAKKPSSESASKFRAELEAFAASSQSSAIVEAIDAPLVAPGPNTGKPQQQSSWSMCDQPSDLDSPAGLRAFVPLVTH